MPEPRIPRVEGIARAGDVVVIRLAKEPSKMPTATLLSIRDSLSEQHRETGARFIVVGPEHDATVLPSRLLEVVKRVAELDVLDTRLANDANVIAGVRLVEQARTVLEELRELELTRERLAIPPTAGVDHPDEEGQLWP